MSSLPRTTALIASLFAGLVMVAPDAHSDDWTTLGSDAQRSSWVRASAKTSPSTVSTSDFQFLWKMQLANEVRDGHALTGPVLLDFLISHRGFRSLAFLGGSSGGVFALDTDLARMEWERRFPVGRSSGSGDCPGGMTASLTRPTAAAMPSSLGFGLRGRRTPAKSGVGAPHEGAVTLATSPPPVSRPAPQPTSTRTRAPFRRALRGVTLVYALSADGMLHTLYVSNGIDHVPPIPFLPANSHARGLIVVDDVAYASTANACSGVPDGVWALDLDSGSVTSWKSPAGSVVGPSGVAFAPDGTAYATTADGPLVALEAKTLNLLRTARSSGFSSSPVVFDSSGRDIVAAVTTDGSLKVFEAASLTELASADLPAGAVEGESALAAWRDSTGTHWILVPASSGLESWKVSGGEGAISLERGWQSPQMEMPLPPIVVNGVVFALDGGSPSGFAKLYALEGASGKQLWDSGNSIGASARGHTLSSGPGHVFLTTADSAFYAFGFPMEH